MKFEDMPLHVPSLKKINAKISSFIDGLNNATCKEDAIKVVTKSFKYDDELSTDFSIISVRNSLNTADPVYEKAQEVCDEVLPAAGQIMNEFNKAYVHSKYRKDLDEKFGKYYGQMLQAQLEIFTEKNIPLMIEENKLTTEYSKILGTAQIEFNGGVYNTSQISKFFEDKDEKIRKGAADALYAFYASVEPQIGEIYSKLVLNRDEQARNLGFKNYIPLGYKRLGRLDYGPEEVAKYREQIRVALSPVVKDLTKRQAARLGVKKIKYYNSAVQFLSGNAVPKGTTEEKIQLAKKMYHEMSEETDTFFNFMVDNHLLDLEARPGKQPGGYMTSFPKYKSPFIFSNFNGTSGDVDVLTHEFGHAFQGYCSQNIKVPSYRSPTLEACEIHSMSMEFLTYPWMKYFFGDQTEKYEFTHLQSTVEFLPYGVTVDEFQHFVYENPHATHEERCAKWNEISAKYPLYVDCSENEFLSHGGKWIRQTHIFQSPFYYIDYTLAQVCAFQFFNAMNVDREKAWKKYVKLCKLGGKYPFVELLAKAHLKNPFEEGNVKKILRPVAKALKDINDKDM